MEGSHIQKPCRIPKVPLGPKPSFADPADYSDAAFLLTVGSFLLRVEFFLLTVGNCSFFNLQLELVCLVFLLTVELLCLQCESVSEKCLNGL